MLALPVRHLRLPLPLGRPLTALSKMWLVPFDGCWPKSTSFFDPSAQVTPWTALLGIMDGSLYAIGGCGEAYGVVHAVSRRGSSRTQAMQSMPPGRGWWAHGTVWNVRFARLFLESAHQAPRCSRLFFWQVSGTLDGLVSSLALAHGCSSVARCRVIKL